MSEQTFTPGPWVCHSGMVWKDGPNVWPKGDDNGIPIARMDRETSETHPTARDANARLIAAAPELYEQCKRFEKVLSELVIMGEADIHDRDKLRGLLAKVERNREKLPVYASVDDYAGHMFGRGEA